LFIFTYCFIGGNNGAFAKLERNELSFSEFCRNFEKECKDEGHSVSSKEFIHTLEQNIYSKGADPKMLHAISNLRSKGIKTCAVTNNWYSTYDFLCFFKNSNAFRDDITAMDDNMSKIHSYFDEFVEVTFK
jgi:hypothetical protein